MNTNERTNGQAYSEAQRAEVWVKVAEAYLESDETDAADNFCSKVKDQTEQVPGM